MKKHITIFLLAIMLAPAVYAGTGSDVLKSAILPGWGQAQYNRMHSRILLGTDLTLLGTFASLTWYEGIQQNDLEKYAAQYANADLLLDSERYWADLSAYISYEDHRTEMLENRTPELIYDEQYAWDWIETDKANTYLSMRRDRDITRNRQTMVLGALVFNRVISIVDMLYLKNISRTVSMNYRETSVYRGLSLQFRMP